MQGARKAQNASHFQNYLYRSYTRKVVLRKSLRTSHLAEVTLHVAQGTLRELLARVALRKSICTLALYVNDSAERGQCFCRKKILRRFRQKQPALPNTTMTVRIRASQESNTCKNLKQAERCKACQHGRTVFVPISKLDFLFNPLSPSLAGARLVTGQRNTAHMQPAYVTHDPLLYTPWLTCAVGVICRDIVLIKRNHWKRQSN